MRELLAQPQVRVRGAQPTSRRQLRLREAPCATARGMLRHVERRRAQLLNLGAEGRVGVVKERGKQPLEDEVDGGIRRVQHVALVPW
eukprot:1156318-Prymnesium_polylepis.1